QEGEGNLARATPPDLNTQPGFSDRFAIHPESDRLLADGVREFAYTLRPRNENVTEIPSVSISFYNPKTDRYESARSESIPLRVTPAPPAAAAPSPAAPDVPVIRPDDVLTEKLAETGTSSSDRLRLWRELVYAIALLLGAVALGYAAWRYRKRREPRIAP